MQSVQPPVTEFFTHAHRVKVRFNIRNQHTLANADKCLPLTEFFGVLEKEPLISELLVNVFFLVVQLLLIRSKHFIEV